MKIGMPGQLHRVKRRQAETHNGVLPSSVRCRCAWNPDRMISCGPGGPRATALLSPSRLPLSPCQLHELYSILPGRVMNCRWNLVYSTDEHGFSLPHFYREVEPFRGSSGLAFFVVHERGGKTISSPTSPKGEINLGSPVAMLSPLLEIHKGPIFPPSKTRVIGAFFTEFPNLARSPHRFFGGRETFVFAFDSVFSDKEKNVREKAGLVAHRWGGVESNSEFMVCGSNFMGIGGGRDGAAIYIDGELQFGSSASHCVTFNSPSLFANGGSPLSGKGLLSSSAKLQQQPQPVEVEERGNNGQASEFAVLRMYWFQISSDLVFPDADLRLSGGGASSNAPPYSPGYNPLCPVKNDGLAHHACDLLSAEV